MLDRYEAEKTERLAYLGRRLEGGPHGEARARLATALFGRVAAEDLVGYDVDDLAAFVDHAWSGLAQRPRGTSQVRLIEHRSRSVATDENGRIVTVVEIVNDDMPFLLDSAMGEFAERGLDVRLVAHPILAVLRDAEGRLERFGGLADAATPAGERESLITVHFGRALTSEERSLVVGGLAATFSDVSAAVVDWHAMRTRIVEAAAEWRTNRPPVDEATLGEAEAFVEWLADDNFTFLGLREYDYRSIPGDEALERRDETGLGILRDPDVRVLKRGGELVALTPEIREFLQRPDPLIITKSNVRSRVHRRIHMEYIGLKRFDADGRLAGELRLVGLFTHGAYTRSVRKIPVVRRKVDAVLARHDFDPASHSGKALLNILESYPRDELFQIEVDTLAVFAGEILELGERPRVRVLARHDKFDRFVSLLVYVPRERATGEVEARVAERLAGAYDGWVAASSFAYPEGRLARLHVIVGRGGGVTPDVDRTALEAEIAAIVRTWPDALREAATAAFEPQHAAALLARYAGAFSAAYSDTYPVETALADVRVLQRLGGARQTAVQFDRRPGDGPERVSLRLFHVASPVPLSDRVPVLEAMGFRVVNERTFRIAPAEASLAYLHDMTLERVGGAAVDLERGREALEALFMAVWLGGAESDGYNGLCLSAGIGWREITMIRALSRYLRQARIAYSQDYMWGTLNRFPAIAAQLVALFAARFDPDRGGDRTAAAAAIRADIETALEAVTSLDDDVILRRFVNLVEATVRTNFFAIGEGGRPVETLAFKLDSRAIDDLPAPRPFREIWVYSPRVEGVHLRFGKVARGGLRWSDRPQDFRTEVLGLVKAQQVKNAVIVPVGAKGGFLPKRLPPAAAGREAWLAEGTEAYKIFVSTLLSISDNLDGDRIVPPDRVVRHDDDDPYLVVAADKGTATFSDTANAIAEAHRFWLGDAFASGGSAGYDHKKMGITARGAWEAVKRHFREIDVDVQTTPFSVVGVGDMSGDVFGNGMLLSPAIRLVAAFDHRDVFLDPDPDPAASLAERARLFALPRSSWQDYDKSLVSAGGGVFSRSLKSIPLSDAVRALLKLDRPHATPNEIIAAILRAPADLLWFGGIGTYVRASAETDVEVGDRANDAVRIAASELSARVIGEGANLGMTQRGRVEAARRGIRLNTDAIDNSAGVNTSDVEVNIKIALATPMRDGRLDRPGRDLLLAEMTDEVGHLVLRNNYVQTLALSLAERRAAENLGFDRRLMQVLEGRGLLNRSLEFLPDGATLTERARAGQGLTRPELAVLLAYAKNVLYDDLLASPVPDDAYLGAELQDYFPAPLLERFPDAVAGHRLRREIIATAMANALINRGGPAFAVRLADESGADVATIAAAFAAAFDSYRMGELNAAIDGLDNRVPGALQLELYAGVQDLLVNRTTWFLRNADLGSGLEALVGRFRAGIDQVAAALDELLPASYAGERAARAADLAAKGVPQALATELSRLAPLALALDAVVVAERTDVDVIHAAATLYALAAHFRIDAIIGAARAIPVADHYERLAVDRSIDRLTTAIRLVAGQAAALGVGEVARDAWLEAHPEAQRVLGAVAEIVTSGLTLAKLTVAASLIGDLGRGD